MSAVDRDLDPEIRQGDLWAWTVSFVVTLGLHVGIVLFITLSIALAIYATATTLALVSQGISAITWTFTVISLIVWVRLVKQQARGFRPHVIRGLGKVTVATSGCERGEIAADVGAGLIGLAQVIPLAVSLLSVGVVPEQVEVITALIGGLLIAVGSGSLALRLWLHKHRLENANQQQAP